MNSDEIRARAAAALPAYDIGAPVGRGGFGLVLAGRHRELGWDVAIKALPTGEDGTTAAGQAEARTLAQLASPHIVSVRDAASDDRLYLIVMELLAGGTLAQRKTGMTGEVACAVGLAVVTGLAEAHRKGVLHRDIKPGNVLFDAAGTPKVADFGIAKLMEGTKAQASQVIGTLLYMAPEQFRAEQLAAATDLYALGVMLYRLLSGAYPFSPNLSTAALVHHHINVPPPPLTGVPAPVADVVLRTLAKDPADRPRSAGEFARALADAATAGYGPGWADQTGITLHLDRNVRAVVGPHPAPPPPPETSPPETSPPTGGEPDPPERPVSRWAHGLLVPLRHPRRGSYQGLSGLLFSGGVVSLLASVAFRAVGHHQEAGGVSLAVAFFLAVLGGGLDAVAGRLRREVRSVAFASPDRLVIATTGGRSWSVSTLGRRHPVALSAQRGRRSGDAMALTPGGGLLAVSSSRDQLWDVSDVSGGRPLGTLREFDASGVHALALSPDGRILAAGLSRRVRRWDISAPADPRPLDPAFENSDPAASVAFSADGHTLAVGCRRAVRFWDLSDPDNPRRLHSVLEHDGAVLSVAFSRDGRTIATGVRKTVRLWDVSDLAAPRQLHLVLEHDAQVGAITFSPDGRTLAVGTGEAVQLWEAGGRAPGLPRHDVAAPSV